MPKLPGRTSSRKTVPLEFAECMSFLFPWEQDAFNRLCCIEGCGHVSGDLEGQCNVEGGAPARVVDKRKWPGPKPDPYVGVCCPCCEKKILEG